MILSKLDQKDKSILEALDLNARYFISDIAKKVKLNKEVVKYRIHNLEKRGVIKGYNTLINYSKLGLMSLEVRINLMDTTNKDIDAIIEFVQTSPHLQLIKRCDVNWDIIFTLVVSDLKSFYDFYEEVKKKFRRFIEMQQISITTNNTLFSRCYVNKAEKRRVDIYACAEKEEFDVTDIQILKIIAYDAKCPLIDIAKKLDLDSMTIERRIDSMVKKGIITGFHTVIDSRNIGMTNYTLFLQLFDLEKAKTFREHVSSLPQTKTTRQAIGGYDVEFEVEVPDYYELESIINELRENFPIIREIVTFTTLKRLIPNLHEQFEKIIVFPKSNSNNNQS